MSNFDKFMEKHGDKLYAKAKKNTKYNAQGYAVISKNDEWIGETEWDELYNSITKNEVVTNEKYTTKGNMVCAVPT